MQWWFSQMPHLLFSIEDISYGDPFEDNEIIYETQLAQDNTVTPFQAKYINFPLTNDKVELNNFSNDYILDNFIDKACYYTVIIDAYKNSFDKYYSTFELNYEFLYEFVTGDELTESSDLSCSFSMIRKFFKEYNLGVVVFDHEMRIRCEYHPKKRNSNIQPYTLYLMLYNNHVTRINENVNSVSHKLKVFKEDNDLIKAPSKYYYIPKEKENEYFTVINNVNDVLELLKNDKETKIFTAIYNGDLLELWQQIRSHLNFECGINFRGSLIDSLYISNIVYKQTKNTIKITDIFTMSAGQIFIDNTEEYKKFIKVKNNFSSKIINKSYLSSYSSNLSKYFQYYKRGGVVGGFVLDEMYDSFVGLDYNKYFPSMLKKMPKIPVCNSFDDLIEYHNEPIEEMNLYFYEKLDDVITYPTKKYGFMYGYNYINRKPNVKLHFVFRPSVLKENVFSNSIDELFNDETLEMSLKKFIANSTIGMLNKRYNNTNYSKAFTNKQEAYSNYRRYGGNIYEHYLKSLEELNKDIYDSKDEKVYFHYLSKRTELNDGFYLIGLFIYDTAEAELFDLVDKARERGMNVYGVNTDCIYVDSIKGKWDLGNGIGQLKIEEKEVRTFKELTIEQNENIIKLDTSNNINVIEINDEWDKEEIKSKLVNRTIIQAVQTAGAGKTTALKQLENALFVIPFNSQREDLTNDGFNAITHYKLLGLRMTESSTQTISQFDITGYKNIIFDECGLHTVKDKERIFQYMKEHPNINFYGTLDFDQLRPIEDLNNVKDIDAYNRNIIYKMFPNHIYLKQNKRMKTEEDRMKSKEISQTFLTGTKEQIINCIKKNFNVVYDIKDVKTTKNIVAFNDTHDWINKHFDKGYYVGLKMICKIQILRKESRTYVNFIYTIKKLGKTVILSNREGDIEVSHDELRRNFKMAYGQTCHSAQGLTFNEPFTIFDALSYMADGRWLYTAYTRTTHFKNITFCLNKGNEITKMKSIIRSQLNNHQIEDKKQNRKFDLTVEWVFNQIKNCGYICKICKTGLDITGYESFSVDRIDNDHGHIKMNCQILCRRCTISKK